MEKILLVKNGELGEVNKLLSEGWKVKFIQSCSEIVSSYGYGYGGGETSNTYDKYGEYTGDIFAYIVVEKS